MNKFVVLIVQGFLVSSVCQAQALKMAQPGAWAGDWISSSISSRKLLDTLAESVQRAEVIELEAQKREASFSLFEVQKSFQQIQSEKQKRISELRYKIVEARSRVGLDTDSSLSALESELVQILTERAKLTISTEVYDPIEEMLEINAGLLEQGVSADSYVVPGVWVVPTGGSSGDNSQGSSERSEENTDSGVERMGK